MKKTVDANVPRHVAIIMDGNGRWARKRFLPRAAGHKAGVDSVRRVIEAAIDARVEVLTLFAFSSENWRRPQLEVGFLMDLFVSTLQRELDRLKGKNVRVRFIGDRHSFPEKLRDLMNTTEAQTSTNTGLVLVIAAGYGGQWDIATAAQRLAAQVLEGKLAPSDITPSALGQQIALSDLPPPDLFIRTGGEQRISNFLMWQLAYTELYFTDLLWPDFDAVAFAQALADFAGRQRRFGHTPEQIEQMQNA
jgi:undecaprenyl diphosphate synthase